LEVDHEDDVWIALAIRNSRIARMSMSQICRTFTFTAPPPITILDIHQAIGLQRISRTTRALAAKLEKHVDDGKHASSQGQNSGHFIVCAAR
jgi:hypothetical protein